MSTIASHLAKQSESTKFKKSRQAKLVQRLKAEGFEGEALSNQLCKAIVEAKR
jgi:hypothetical protein